MAREFGIDKKQMHGIEYLEAYEDEKYCEITVIEKSEYQKLKLLADKMAAALECSQTHSFYCPWIEGKGINPNLDECTACEALKKYRQAFKEDEK